MLKWLALSTGIGIGFALRFSERHSSSGFG
jgi:hypothetical protein